MRRLFSRLFYGLSARADLHPQRACFVIGPDIAHEDWAPVPPSAVGTDWGTWLQEGLEAPPSSPGAESAEESRYEPREEQRWREVLVAFAEHLTEEELLIIKKQMSG